MDSQKKVYKHLSGAQREQLGVLLQQGYTQQRIANELGVATSTISREIRRHGGHGNYCSTKAEQRATEQRRLPKKPTKVSKEHWRAVRKGLRLGWSPQKISGHMASGQCGQPISHTTIYRMLEKDRAAGGELYKLLPGSGKTRMKDASAGTGTGAGVTESLTPMAG